jgi:hypothetical protein
MRAAGRLLGIAILALLVLLPCASRAERAPAPEDRILETLPLEDIAPRERERVVETIRRLLRIHRAAGDPGRGEAEKYVDAVELLARTLKRETIEERRRLYLEAAEVFRDEVDREWIDRAFREAREGDFPSTEANSARFDEQAAALRRVGALLKEEQEIVARHKAMTAGAERRYREILRLNKEGRRLLESIGHAPIQGALQWILDDLNHVFEEVVRPAHDRQVRLVALYKRVAADVGSSQSSRVVSDYREYASKLRAIARQLGRPGGAHSD